MTALIQNISIPADNDVEVTLKVSPDVGLDTLADSTIYWRVYEQELGVPTFGVPALIVKTTDDGSILILPSPTPMICLITVSRADTAGLLRNYYHEATIKDVAGNWSTLNCGILTITATENR